MSVDFEGGSGKIVRACLHLVTLCICRIGYPSDLLLLATKNRYKSDLELGLSHDYVKEINRYALHFIHHQPIKRLKNATGESGNSSG